MSSRTIFRNPLLVVMIALTSLLLSSSGCRKKEDTIVKIYVYDQTGAPVSGATVRLRGESTVSPSPPVVLDKTASTNSSGEATFDFNDVYQLGQAGVAVLNIEASFAGLNGTGIIKVEQETTSEEDVFIQ